MWPIRLALFPRESCEKKAKQLVKNGHANKAVKLKPKAQKQKTSVLKNSIEQQEFERENAENRTPEESDAVLKVSNPVHGTSIKV